MSSRRRLPRMALVGVAAVAVLMLMRRGDIVGAGRRWLADTAVLVREEMYDFRC